MAPRSTSKTKREIIYPLLLRRGGVTVKVYRIEKPSRGTIYVVSYYRGGARQQDTFRDEGVALKHGTDTVEALAEGKGESLALGNRELES